MIFVGIDDTDVAGAPGTNQLAKRLAVQLSDRYHCRMILRHQLLVDPRIPYTSKNSAATLVLTSFGPPREPLRCDKLFDEIATFITRDAALGSDPGLCIAENVPQSVIRFGGRCKDTLCQQREAIRLAEMAGLLVAGLGGTEDGVIGAVAAVGLAATGNDGRVVLVDGQDDLSGVCPIAELLERQVEVRCQATDLPVTAGRIDVGKHLRPNLRGGKLVQFARQETSSATSSDPWKAVRLP